METIINERKRDWERITLWWNDGKGGDEDLREMQGRRMVGSNERVKKEVKQKSVIYTLFFTFTAFSSYFFLPSIGLYSIGYQCILKIFLINSSFYVSRKKNNSSF